VEKQVWINNKPALDDTYMLIIGSTSLAMCKPYITSATLLPMSMVDKNIPGLCTKRSIIRAGMGCFFLLSSSKSLLELKNAISQPEKKAEIRRVNDIIKYSFMEVVAC
jgi:hypothetical protein